MALPTTGSAGITIRPSSPTTSSSASLTAPRAAHDLAEARHRALEEEGVCTTETSHPTGPRRDRAAALRRSFSKILCSFVGQVNASQCTEHGRLHAPHVVHPVGPEPLPLEQQAAITLPHAPRRILEDQPRLVELRGIGVGRNRKRLDALRHALSVDRVDAVLVVFARTLSGHPERTRCGTRRPNESTAFHHNVRRRLRADERASSRRLPRQRSPSGRSRSSPPGGRVGSRQASWPCGSPLRLRRGNLNWRLQERVYVAPGAGTSRRPQAQGPATPGRPAARARPAAHGRRIRSHPVRLGTRAIEHARLGLPVVAPAGSGWVSSRSALSVATRRFRRATWRSPSRKPPRACADATLAIVHRAEPGWDPKHATQINWRTLDRLRDDLPSTCAVPEQSTHQRRVSAVVRITPGPRARVAPALDFSRHLCDGPAEGLDRS